MPQTMAPTSPLVICVDVGEFRRESSDALDFKFFSGVMKADLRALLDTAFENAAKRDDALIRVVPAVEDQGAERIIVAIFRRRKIFHDRLENLVDADSGFALQSTACAMSTRPIISSISLEHAIGVRGWKIDLVHGRENFEVAVERHENVGERLRLDALRSIDHEDRAFASGERARDFVSEVDVPGRIDQVENVVCPSFAL